MPGIFHFIRNKNKTFAFLLLKYDDNTASTHLYNFIITSLQQKISGCKETGPMTVLPDLTLIPALIAAPSRTAAHITKPALQQSKPSSQPTRLSLPLTSTLPRTLVSARDLIIHRRIVTAAEAPSILSREF
jgi:hypothetical protein